MTDEKFLRAVTYSRVSTANHDQKPEIQVDELRRYAEARGWQIDHEITDHGYSGGTDQRPGLKQLMALARTRKVEIVAVTKLDRMARSLKHLVTILDELSSLGIQFVSIQDQIDMGTASGRLMLHIVAAFAEFERALIRERTIAGLAYARSRGKRLGRPRSRDDNGILALRLQGLSYNQIQRRLGCERSSIYRALKAVGKTQSKLAFQVAEKEKHRRAKK